ncbi:MAG: hypothetical protein PHY93_19435, partial [Bacteriovorax sp.]|nr:hypothetical protein [Bacteriovorax sp.]
MKKYIYLILFYTQISFATVNDQPTRWIDLEWDEVPGAKGYDIELSEVIDQKEFSRGLFHTDTPHWAKEANPGKYNVKIRALDNRKVPGPWGETIPVVIRLVSPQLIRPLDNEILTTSEMNDLSITFQWGHVPGAIFYQLIVFNSKNIAVLDEVTKDIEVKYKISNIDNYKWYVLPMFAPEEKKAPEEFLANLSSNLLANKAEFLKEKKFAIKGQMLKAPVIEVEVIKKRGFLFRWNEVFRADNYSFEVFKVDELDEGKSLRKILNGTSSKRQIAIGKDKLPDGKYVIAIKAISHNYQDSENARVIIKSDKDHLEIISNESTNKESIS